MSDIATIEKTETQLDKSAIREFAVNARRKLKEKVELQANKMGFFADNRAVQYEFEDDTQFKINGETFSKSQANILRREIQDKGFDIVVDEVAYTWFNRFIALYYMECHNYIDNGLNIVSSIDDLNQTAMKAPNYFRNLNKEMLFSAIQNNDSDAVYRTLIIAQCNELNNKLPFLFEKISDYTELLFPSGMLNNDSVIREMLALDKKNWEQVEIIGWLYQYYIAEAKEKLDYELKNKKNRKVQKEDMPAKTQIFTPKWIVQYMVQNSVGKLWLEAHPNQNLQAKFKYYLESAEQEEDVKKRLEEIVNKSIRPEEIKVLDPACGSGHILVTAFETLYEIYKSAGYLEDEIATLILKNNLYGLDICDRAAQLAQLAIIMKAREYDKNISEKVNELNITSIQETNWIDERVKECLMNGVENKLLATSQIDLLIDTFRDAKEYGSIIDVKDFDFNFWEERLNAVQTLNMGLLYTDVVGYLQKKLPLLIKQAKIMQQKYEANITNPPYLGSTYFDSKLTDFIKSKYPNSKSDLCVAFIEKLLKMTQRNCYCSLVTMQSWMFLSSFETFRENLLNNATITTMTHMGNGVMRIAFGTCATIWKKTLLPEYKATYSWVENDDIKENDEPYIFPIKNNGRYSIVSQDGFHLIPGSPIAYWASERIREIFATSNSISKLFDIRVGMHTGSNDLFVREWYEVSFRNIRFNCNSNEDSFSYNEKYYPYNKGGEFRKWYGNRIKVVDWYKGGKNIHAFHKLPMDYNGAPVRAKGLQFKESATWSFVSSTCFGVRYSPPGSMFDVGGSSVFPPHENIYYIVAFLCSKLGFYYLKLLNPTLNFQVGNVGSLPIIYPNDENQSLKINIISKENIQISKDDWDSFETSWDFKIHPLLRFSNFTKGAVDYKNISEVEPITSEGFKIKSCFERWKAYKQEQFNKLKANEEALNRLFIEIYGLQDEMKPDVADKDITVSLADEKREIKSLLSYAVGCMLGRYSLDEEGLAFAGGTFDSHKYTKLEVDEDGILPILSGTWFEDDIIEELKRFLKAAFGEMYLPENMEYIADTLGRKSGESAESTIRNYFLKDFYKDHLQVYKKRPIYWMFTSGKEKAFNCLVYLHRYDKTTLSRIRKDYLHEYQAKLDRAIAQAEDEGNVKLTSLYAKYKAELLEFDAKIKDLADSQIELDLDDGVKVNYAKFKGLLEAEKEVIGKEK